MFQVMSFLLPSDFLAKKVLRLFSSLFVVCLPAQICFGQNAGTSNAAAPLEPGKQLEREISAKQKHDYQITLAEGQFASVIVEQRGIDVSVILVGPLSEDAIAQSDASLKNEGRERIDFTALTAGSYLLEVRGKPRAAAPGRYSILLSETRAATDKERRLEEARKLHNEAIDLYGDGRYAEARAAAERALEIREKESEGETSDIAGTLASLALIFYETGDYEKSVALNERALKIREKVFGTYHQDTARTMHNLGRAYLMVSNYEEAIRVYEKTIEIREKILGPDSADLATSLNNLGSIYQDLADYAKAEQYKRRSLEIKERTLPPNSPSLASSLTNLASVFSVTGDEDKALELYRRALDIREKAFRPDHPEIAPALTNLATSYRTKGEYKQAEALYLRALEILKKNLDLEHYRVGITLGELAVLYQMQGDYARAEPLFQQTVRIMEKSVGAAHFDYATAINNLAEFYTSKGDYQKAEPLYQKALSIAEQNFGAQHPDVILYLKNLARNYQAKGDATEALRNWARARRLSERNAQLLFFTNSERQKLLFFNFLAEETNQLISAHQRFAPNDPAALELALTTIFERKGRVSDAVAQELAALRSRSGSEEQILLDKLRETTSQLARKVLSGPQNSSAEEHRRLIKELEERKENLEIEISRKSAEFRSQTQPVTVAAVQSLIPEDAALVEFSVYRPFDAKTSGNNQAFGEPRYAAYVIRRQGEVRWKDLGPAKAIDAAVESFRQSLRDPKREDFALLARSLDEKVMRPLRALVGDKTHLLVSPDGELNLIPFEALVDERDRYLVENYSFVYLTSGRDLLRMRNRRESKSKPLVVANPAFGEPPAELIAEAGGTRKTKNRGAGKRQSVTVTRDLSGVYFAPLGGAAQEARSIQPLLPEATFLTGAQATESALRRFSAPQILHVATHGFFLEDGAAAGSFAGNARGAAAKTKIENPLLRSGLALAGANRRNANSGGGGGDDGILTALEASGLNLWGTKLVVLSACDTGVGEIKNGEGVYGLRRAFVLAGAESLVMSLWPVSDFVTRELMTGYYKNLKQGFGRGAALRQVQIEMLNKTGRRHPFYWAGFIQSGDWSALGNGATTPPAAARSAEMK